jgi:hypothetical protein
VETDGEVLIGGLAGAQCAKAVKSVPHLQRKEKLRNKEK